MIIWGWTGREIPVERGEFHCPHCNTITAYRKVRVCTYFTLYFIPLFETRHHGDYVNCLSCDIKLASRVLERGPERNAGSGRSQIEGVKQDLEKGHATETVVRKLVRSGMDATAAEWLVAAAAGDATRQCGHCRLSFVPGVDYCSDCGAEL